MGMAFRGNGTRILDKSVEGLRLDVGAWIPTYIAVEVAHTKYIYPQVSHICGMQF